MRNIVLIGMPGSGKTTVGTLVADRLGLTLLDTDAMAAESEGRSIPALFREKGEAYFRDVESAMARRAASAENAVIATGGGMILRPENMRALGKTGVICFLDRPPEDIAQEDHAGRPLIGADRDRILRLYHQRIGLYRRYAQCTVDNRGTAEEAAESLVRKLEGKR